MACHTFNMPFMALNLRDPISVQADSAGHNRDSYPKWSKIAFEFPANEKRPGVKAQWYDGGKKPDAALLDGEKMEGSGCIIIGEKGKLLALGDYCNGYKLLGGAEKPSKIEYEKSPGHFKEFALAIKGGPPAMSNFPDYAGPLSETILLGNLAVYAAAELNASETVDGKKTEWATGKKIEWDAKNLKATNAPEVEAVVHPTYREGYTL